MKPRLVSRKSKKAEQLKAAMPEVRALCEKHGRSIVNSCVQRIAKYEKASAQVERLRREAQMLEQKLMIEQDAAKAV